MAHCAELRVLNLRCLSYDRVSRVYEILINHTNYVTRFFHLEEGGVCGETESKLDYRDRNKEEKDEGGVAEECKVSCTVLFSR